MPLNWLTECEILEFLKIYPKSDKNENNILE